ncbi:efflux RND transporter periplasmic adaptor subunit [Mesobacillus zeae]|uniref:Efflux RND transporter periplasmic adaptor subunit n=1 Tax=Mesobacillus zeae TaxID=1917180 RepID=A0A398B3V5_9BACI|nr:efflux RND transporter periplasmic adaptor subunit [Mesobacillus zeae]RID82640.1 efflux RND transporter periplasmic adaptor subunit [Mesobacillus zeae]
MKKKATILLAAGAVFVSGNLYLSMKDDAKAKRSTYLNSWEQTKSEDLKLTLGTAGVVTPLEEHHVYYNEKPGGFKEFLVKKGDKVDEGTPLYHYASDEGDSGRKELESEKSQLAREAALIDEQIQQLTYLKSVSSSSGSSTAVTGDGTYGTPPPAGNGELLSASIEKEIFDKQTEKNRILAEIGKYDELLQSENEEDGLGINSDVTGVVKDVNYKLENPIMTIISDKPKVEGTFAESDLKKVEEGMEVYVTSSLFKGKVPGMLTKISTYPEEKPSVKKKSQFPYEIELDEDSKKIVQGSHVDVQVVTDKVLDAATVSEKAVEKEGKKSYVYILNESGKVEKRKFKKGIQRHGRVEAEGGVKKKELVAKRPEDIKKAGDPFFTPLNIDHLAKQPFKEASARSITKYIMIGFSKR